MMKKEIKLKNILFDLGGVLLDIDFQSTVKAFYELGFPSELLQYPHSKGTDVFHRYECGKIDTETFKKELRVGAGVQFSDKEFLDAWNVMILRFPDEHINLLDKLKERYKLYMLSNTSELHVAAYEKMYKEKAGRPIQEVFDGIYYSHEIGYRKPDPDAWKHVIKKTGIKAEETLYLDDMIQNVKAAKELRFQAIHIHERTTLMHLGFDL